MNLLRSSAVAIVLAGSVTAAAFAADAPAAPTPAATGTTMRIQQQMEMGDLSAATDYQAKFLTAGKFRVEGTMNLTKMEMKIGFTVVGDGRTIKQLTQQPFGLAASTVDLERVHKAIPDYDPSQTYDPRVYKKMVTENDATRLADETIDGVKCDGYQAVLPEGRLSLPSNVPLGLPDPAKIRVWLNPEDGIARRVELEDRNGVIFMKMLFSQVKTNVAMSDADFEYKFPEGTTPRDMTEMVLGFVAASRAPAPSADKAPAPETEKPKEATQPQ